MKAVRSTLLLAALASTIVSCSDKDDNKITTGLEGEYTLVNVKAETSSTAIGIYEGSSDIDSAITTCSYKSIQASGTISVNATNFISNKLTYSIFGDTKTKAYRNGQERPDLNVDGTLYRDAPASNGNSTYKLIGTDSIYFSGGGGIPGPVFSIGPVNAQPGAAKFTWSGDTLVITSYLDSTSQAIVNNHTDWVIMRAKIVTRLKKK